MTALLTRFARDTRANIAMVFALSLSALAAAMGGGLDYSRSASIGTELQAALDSGVLAAASLSQDGDPEAVVRAYVEAAIGDHPGLIETLTLTVTSEVDLNSRQVGAEAAVRVPTTLLGMAGVNHLTVRRDAGALERARKIEIALVLDISSSMGGRRIDNLREASLDFVDTVLAADNRDMTSISVIPYGGTVRLPDRFYRYVIPRRGPPWHTLDALGYRVRLPNSVSEWNGCLEMTEAQARSITLDDGEHSVLPEFTVWNRGNDWCPPVEGTEAIFLTNDRDDLRATLNTFDNPVLSDGTGTDIATGWGVRALDPAWRGALGGHADFSDRPAAYDDEETMKVMVVMTDGGITQQRRPESDFNVQSDNPHVGTRGTQDLYSKNTARDVFMDMCDYAKDNGVVVYSIAFQVGGGRNKRDMENCASSSAKYYDVESLEIAAAFSAIAAELNQLRLSR
ncbi:MAG: vWA domain-containing protein [Oceanicaulis sp.]